MTVEISIPRTGAFGFAHEVAVVVGIDPLGILVARSAADVPRKMLSTRFDNNGEWMDLWAFEFEAGAPIALSPEEETIARAEIAKVEDQASSAIAACRRQLQGAA